MQRNVEIGRRRGIDAKKSRWRDSRNRERNVIDQDILAGRTRCVAETPLTKCKTQDRDRRCSNPIVIRSNQTPGSRRHLKSAEIVPGDELTAGLLCLGFHHHVDLARGIVSEHARENRAGIVPDELEGGERKDSGDLRPFAIAPCTAAHAVHHKIAPGGVRTPIQYRQRLRIGDR